MIRSHGATTSGIESDLGFLQGMTTGSAEAIDFFLAFYEDPIGMIAALRDVPAALLNLDEPIAAMPDAIEAQQGANNPHELGGRYYDDYRQGWYEGYLAWFVVEPAVPAGEVQRAAKSSETLQSTVDSLSTPRIRQAAQAAGRAGHTTTAPKRYVDHQLARGISGGLGVTQEVGERPLGQVPSSGAQYQVASCSIATTSTVTRLSESRTVTASCRSRYVYCLAERLRY